MLIVRGGASHGMEGGSVADRVLRGHSRKWIANKTEGGGRVHENITEP